MVTWKSSEPSSSLTVITVLLDWPAAFSFIQRTDSFEVSFGFNIAILILVGTFSDLLGRFGSGSESEFSAKLTLACTERFGRRLFPPDIVPASA